MARTEREALPTHVLFASGPPAEQARALLHAYGFRATDQRTALLTELMNEPAPGHLSIVEVHQRARVDGRPIDFSTVYRAVLALTAAGVLHALAAPERATTYGLADRPHHHAVCTSCGEVTEIPAERLSGALTRARRASMLALSTSGSLTLHGLCAECAVSDTSAPHPVPKG